MLYSLSGNFFNSSLDEVMNVSGCGEGGEADSFGGEVARGSAKAHQKVITPASGFGMGSLSSWLAIPSRTLYPPVFGTIMIVIPKARTALRVMNRKKFKRTVSHFLLNKLPTEESRSIGLKDEPGQAHQKVITPASGFGMGSLSSLAGKWQGGVQASVSSIGVDIETKEFPDKEYSINGIQNVESAGKANSLQLL
jgi:hypothetical protein